MREIDYIVIHCTAASANQKTSVILDYWSRPKSKGGLGWENPGYHILISADGSMEQLLPFDKVSNGVQGFNSRIINICYKGGDSLGTDTRTIEQKEAILEAINKALLWCEKFHTKEQLSKIRIVGHRDFSRDLNRDGKITPNEWEKTCPCFDAEEEYYWITGKEALKNKGKSIKK